MGIITRVPPLYVGVHQLPWQHKTLVSPHHKFSEIHKDYNLSTQVFVGDILCGKVNYVAGQVVYKVVCEGGIVGDSVKIKNTKTYLTLCEVKVMGKNEVALGKTRKKREEKKISTKDQKKSSW